MATWKPIVLKSGEGEKILFRIGLITVKASSKDSNDNFMICETIMPPGANVEPHSHPEAETFYILSGDFVFFINDMEREIECKKGSFISVPPNMLHAFRNSGKKKGLIFGSMTPGGEKGLESLFRTFGIPVTDDMRLPDPELPIENWTAALAEIRKNVRSSNGD